VAATAFGARPASAQATTVVVPSVGVGAIYDDNVTWSPQASSDHVWRLTPAIDVTRDTVRSRWRLDALVDADWYVRERDLSTPAATQHAATTWTWRRSSRTTFAIDGGYDSSLNPADINVGTGLTLGRVRAWRWEGHPEVTRDLTTRWRLVSAYRVTGEFASATTGIVTHAGEIGLRAQAGPRDQIDVVYTGEIFHFLDLGHAISHRGTVQWTHRITPAWALTAAGGGRIIEHDVKPDVDVQLGYSGRWTRFTTSYAWTQATTLGLTRLIDVHRGLATLDADTPGGFGASLTGGVYRNAFAAERADVYRAAAEIRHTIGRPLWIGVSYAVDYQRGRVGPAPAGGALLLPADAPIIRGPDPATANVRRNTLMVRLIVSGRIESASGPSALEGQPPRLPARGGAQQ
jgi:hypothetical protein